MLTLSFGLIPFTCKFRACERNEKVLTVVCKLNKRLCCSDGRGVHCQHCEELAGTCRTRQDVGGWYWSECSDFHPNISYTFIYTICIVSVLRSILRNNDTTNFFVRMWPSRMTAPPSWSCWRWNIPPPKCCVNLQTCRTKRLEMGRHLW